jgi:hypothetical protein
MKSTSAHGVVCEQGAYTSGTLAGALAVGLPITEAYWTQANIGGRAKDVLVQGFQRRCLTFAPATAPAWQNRTSGIVEMMAPHPGRDTMLESLSRWSALVSFG